MKPLVRFAARDPGGANVLAAVLARQRELRCDVWTLPRASPAFEREGFRPREFQQFSVDELRAAWGETPAELLITGTSHYEAFEPRLWQIARSAGGVSLAVNDAWTNIAPRFAEARPDFVGALDPGQAEELVALGFAPGQVRVTGQPWLADLVRRRDEVLARGPAAPRHADGRVRVLFVSEPIASDVAAGSNAPFGFDEFDSFALLHAAAAEAARMGPAPAVAIRFHPYEDPRQFLRRLESLAPAAGGEVLRSPAEDDAQRWLLWADLVVGIGSTLLLEAIALGRPVVSLQPGRTREDTFIASRRGFAEALVDSDVARERLRVLLTDAAARAAEQARNAGFLRTLQVDPAEAVRDWIGERLRG